MYAVKQPTTASLKSNVAVDRRVTGSGTYIKVRKASVLGSGSRVNGHGSVRAVISGGDKAVEASTPVQSKDVTGSLVPSSSEGIQVKAVVTIRKKMKEKITEKIEDQWEFFVNGIGQGIMIQLISDQVDPVTNSGKSVQSAVRGWLPRPLPSDYAHIVEYAADFTVPSDFGSPGAILITNLQGKEFYLLEIVIHDPLSESRIEKPHPVYVPRDETFEEIKQNTFSAGRLKALLHNLLPSLAATLSSSDIPFKAFSDIDDLYNDGVLIKEEEQKEGKILFLGSMVKEVLTVGERWLKYEIPAVIKRDRFAWLRDNEFARQTLAGVNPVNIEILKAIEDKRLFILDYHDIFMPFIEKMNSLPGRKAYASRTVFFFTPTGIMRPIAIELSLPPTSSSPHSKHVYTHGHHATTHWIWKLAKAHVCSNDAGIHQLVNHW
ncbi:hypothetical protein GBA52_003358 [Prunus armeniaca]|nr:hypothetical protein GBA52_003358 [Prunus armeniaca]